MTFIYDYKLFMLVVVIDACWWYLSLKVVTPILHIIHSVILVMKYISAYRKQRTYLHAQKKYKYGTIYTKVPKIKITARFVSEWSQNWYLNNENVIQNIESSRTSSHIVLVFHLHRTSWKITTIMG